MSEPCKDPKRPRVCQDAAIALALAETAVPYAGSLEDEAERWLRVLRLHGQVGSTLQALGVSESPLETMAQPRVAGALRHRSLGERAVETVSERACALAAERDAPAVGTVDVLFAVLQVYGRAFDRALYVRGTTREELLECLSKRAETRPQA